MLDLLIKVDGMLMILMENI